MTIHNTMTEAINAKIEEAARDILAYIEMDMGAYWAIEQVLGNSTFGPASKARVMEIVNSKLPLDFSQNRV